MIKDWPKQERPREKLLSQGPASLSDAELLAIFLRTGVKGCNVVDLARNLLLSFGSINAIFQATHYDFCRHHGLGTAKYVQLQACLEMSKRSLSEELNQGEVLASSQLTRDYLLAQLGRETREVFGILLLDNQHKVIKFERLFYGTIDSAAVYPRIVVEHVLKYHAAAVILTHNHPSGVTKPSLADRKITTKLTAALALIDVSILDHIIVAGHTCYSFAENGDI